MTGRRLLLVVLASPFLAAAAVVAFWYFGRATVEYAPVDPGVLVRLRIGAATMVGSAVAVAAWVLYFRYFRRR